MNEALQQIIEMVKQASPFLWHAAYRYVVVDAIMGILFGFLLVGGMVPLMRYLIKKYEDSDGIFLAWIGIVMSIIISAVIIFMSVQQLLTLDYAAIQALTKLVNK